jgi:hypothetical protein
MVTHSEGSSWLCESCHLAMPSRGLFTVGGSERERNTLVTLLVRVLMPP